MDPNKLNKFTHNKLVLQVADKYIHHLFEEEMPQGLKKYMDLKLFPWIHLKVGCGISLATAHCWLHSEGFKYANHKKGLYFDGHNLPDMVEYWQNVFLPATCVVWGWKCWEGNDYSKGKLCWVSIGLDASRQNDFTSQWYHAEDVGLQQAVYVEKEGSGMRAPSDWSD